MGKICRLCIWVLMTLPLFSFLTTKKRLKSEEMLSSKYLDERDYLYEKVAELSQKTIAQKRIIDSMDLVNRLLEKDVRSEKSAYDVLRSKCNELLGEKENLSKERNQLNLELKEKEQQLKKKEAYLQDLEKNLIEQQKEYIQLEQNLKEKMVRIEELEHLLSSQREQVRALKNKISQALKGFNDSELSVELKNGKIYVSLSNKLLFKTGSIRVDKKGVDAIQRLGQVLEKQTNLDIVVEGHTDNVPYSTNKGEIKNNWDLSVLRATSVVQILIKQSGLNAQHILAAGRADTQPIASNDTSEGRSKNRRIEIVLSPDLESLFDILDSVE